MRGICIGILFVCASCGDNLAGGPFSGLRLDGTFDVGVEGTVHVARDEYGVAHISAASLGDAAFVQGYVMAHDRLPQMDILRRFGAGTLSKLFGALDPDIVDTDLEMRMHRMKPLATESWMTMQANPDDAEVVTLLQRFSDGVNAYATDLKAGRWTIDPAVLVSFDPDRFEDWSPIDSLVLGRFQAFALSWTTSVELNVTEVYDKLRDTFDGAQPGQAAAYARRGISSDLLTLAPVGQVPTIDGFPNVSNVAPRSTEGARRPRVSQATFDRARTFLDRGGQTGPFGAPGPHALMYPNAGSNCWAISPSRANGAALLAGDQHLQLPNPSVFYPTHIMVGNGDGVRDAGELDLLGVTFSGIPGVILGTNGDVAWTSTTSFHDVNDVYREVITPCGSNSCASFRGQQVPLETFTEEIEIGALGTITDMRSATYEVVPHHGPILPEIQNHRIVPRTSSEALSVRYTGHQATYEIRSLWKIAKATTVAEGVAAFEDFTYGSQNWTMIDTKGSIGWTTRAAVPARVPAAYAWDAKTNPDGAAPFFIFPGDGSAEWDGLVDARYVPHAIDPAQGYIVTANSDPVGVTFDGDPLDGPMVDGRPLFLSATYAAGVRTERIAKLVEEQGTAMTLDAMAAIQHDSSSTVGAKLAPFVLAALASLDNTAATPSDAQTYIAGLSTADRDRLARARGLLAGWSFATPTALDAPDPDSAATAIFNAWMHFFLTETIGDEYAAADFDMWRLDENLHVRTVYALLARPETFVQSASTNQPILCDRITTTGPDESCTRMILSTLLQAMTHLASTSGFGSDDTETWRWGKLHRLTMKPLFPNAELELPGPGEASPKGFPKPGDNFVINRADQGWDNLDFSQSADGPAQRFLATTVPGKPIAVRWQLPTGVVYDPTDPHYRDQLDNHYLAEQHFDAPYSIAEIVDAGETRWVFQ
ncbi:MAG: penicillin acylase family protein [Kofleriaceae bacterium]